MKDNPKLSAKPPTPEELAAGAEPLPAVTKPPKPTDPTKVPESEIDHVQGEEAYQLPPPKPRNPLHQAEPIDEAENFEELGEEEDFVPPSAGIGQPPAPPRRRVAKPVTSLDPSQWKGHQDIQKPEEGDPGASKKIEFVRGIAPGTRPTY